MSAHRLEHGSVLLALYMAVAVVTTVLGVSLTRSLNEHRLVDLQQNGTQAFYLAEAAVHKTLWTISQNPSLDNAALTALINGNGTSPLGSGNFQVQITGDASTKTITSTGTVGTTSRRIQVQVQNGWLAKIPAAVYSTSVVKLTFDKRETGDDAYVAGHQVPGVYSQDDVIGKVDGGRISGNPPVAEFQPSPPGLQDGIWDAFDVNGLREIAKANGTYFSADDSSDPYNNGFNKSGKYTLPIQPGQTNGVFFFDAKHGEPLDDNAINPTNEVKVKLRGTTEHMSGVIVVVGDLDIKDTSQYDFLFDGVIIVLDDLKVADDRHHRRAGTNDSDVVIKGAVLSDNVIENGKTRKKKASLTIKNSTVDYNPSAIAAAGPRWTIVPGTWQEL